MTFVKARTSPRPPGRPVVIIPVMVIAIEGMPICFGIASLLPRACGVVFYCMRIARSVNPDGNESPARLFPMATMLSRSAIL